MLRDVSLGADAEDQCLGRGACRFCAELLLAERFRVTELQTVKL